MLKFSLLMSVYYKEKSEYFDRSMQSIWDEQDIKPSEIILVQDGKLNDELYLVINKWKKKLGKNLKIISLQQNVGLGGALNIGIKYCNNELIARMDTDDIAMPNRFAKQIKVFENSDIDICSSWVSEFDKEGEANLLYRKLPEFHYEIITFATKRCPINHPAVMYKKSVILKAGGYKTMLWFEDYYLWSRMILNNSKFYNIQHSLVSMRAGKEQIKRRSGLQYAIKEFIFLKKLKEIGFLSFHQFLVNFTIRFIIRIMPQKLLQGIYKNIREL